MSNAKLQPQEFADSFLKLTSTDPVFVDVGGRDPLAIKAEPARRNGVKALVVLFHGALGRSKGAEVPSFLNIRRDIRQYAHQISIADPGVEISNRVGVGWFAGSADNPSQDLLPDFFALLKDALNVERVVFVGSSGGGFGALYYSWHLPGSIACASVPQTNAWQYNESSLRFFIEDCWPEGLDSYDSPPVLDLRELYSKSVPNTVVYIQSSQDDRHLARHMIPFLESVDVASRSKIALKVSYWGRGGHSGSVPPGELDGWIKAAIAAPDVSAASIVSEYQRSGIESTPLSQTLMRERGAATSRPSVKKHEGDQETAYQDLIWADVVAESQLQEGMENG